jgi:hypothetical protein
MIDVVLFMADSPDGYPIPIPRAEPHFKRFLEIDARIEVQGVQ